MSQLANVDPNVVGIVLVSANGMAELSDADKQTWIRDATDSERQLFIQDCERMTKAHDPKKTFDFGHFAVDGNGQPYWLMTVLEHEATPEIAKSKARQYTRVNRINMDY